MVFSRLARPAKLSALLILPFTLLAACAHTPHLPGQSHGTIHETIDFYAGEHTALVVSEGEFIAADKNTLSFTHYRPETGANGVAVVYFHGIESHGAWFEGPSSLLAEQGYDVYALDRRGSGRNQSGRGFTPGYAEDYEQLLSDIDEFLKTIDGRHRRVVLAGSSWGGKLALAYALEYPRQKVADSLILITPGLSAHVDLALHKKVAVITSLLFNPDAQFDVPIPTELFTHNAANLALIAADPLRLHQVTARFFFESLRLDWFIADKVEHNRLPILLVLAGQDRVINNDGVREVLAPSQAPLEVIEYPEETHAVQLDAPERLARDMAAWIGGAKAAREVSLSWSMN